MKQEKNKMKNKTKTKAKQSKAKQSKAKRSKAKQSEAKRSEAKQSKAKQSKAKRSEAKQSKAKQSKAKQSKTNKGGREETRHSLDVICSVPVELVTSVYIRFPRAQELLAAHCTADTAVASVREHVQYPRNAAEGRSV